MTRELTDGGLKKTSIRTLTVAETVMGLDGATLAEVVAELDLAKSTAYSHLETLRAKGYLVKEGETYHVGLRFLDLGGYAADRKLRSPIIHERVSLLAQETEERAQFIVEENGLGVYLCTDAECPNAVRTDVRIGKQVPLHTTAAGKAILANLPRDRVEEIINRHGLTAATDHSITDPEELFEALDTVRRRGYAFNRGERLEKQWAVGVPVLGEGTTVIGGISVSGPEHRLKGEYFDTELPRLLMGVADEIELNLEFG
jgi:DNA-binding IclR family transcriptional regulator